MFSSFGHKVKTAMEIGATATGLFDLGCGVYQGTATCGPMLMNGLRIIGPMVATAGL